jgi:hypothetical protein
MARPFFPLSFVGGFQLLRGAAVLCRKVHRIFRRNTLLQLVSHAIRSINRCAFSDVGERSHPLSGRTSAQHHGELLSSAWARILRCSRNSRPPPLGTPREALCELLKIESLGLPLDQTTVVSFEWDELELLCDDWQVSPRDICDVAPDHIAEHFGRPGQFRLSAEHADRVGEGHAITPYFDPRLANDRQSRHQAAAWASEADLSPVCKNFKAIPARGQARKTQR